VGEKKFFRIPLILQITAEKNSLRVFCVNPRDPRENIFRIPLILQIIAEKNDSRAFCANPHDLRKKTFINPAYIADHREKK
jgi:hypothetical protein